MDDKDRHILRLLQDNARMPLKTLAAEVGLARSSVGERIARLEATGIIRGYRAVVEPGDADRPVAAMLSVRLTHTPARPAVARIASLPEVRRCVSVSGEVDLVIELEAPDIEALNAARDHIALDPDVADVTTALVLKREKVG